MKIVSKANVEEFLRKCDDAARDLEHKDKLLEVIYSGFERNFSLLGATAVEDRLQDGVPKTIYDL